MAILWCDNFKQGTDATLGCDNGKDIIYSEDQLEDAKSYCEQNEECIGVTKHPNGKYTPRCGNIFFTDRSTSWLNKDGCFTGNTMQ